MPRNRAPTAKRSARHQAPSQPMSVSSRCPPSPNTPYTAKSIRKNRQFNSSPPPRRRRVAEAGGQRFEVGAFPERPTNVGENAEEVPHWLYEQERKGGSVETQHIQGPGLSRLRGGFEKDCGLPAWRPHLHPGRP